MRSLRAQLSMSIMLIVLFTVAVISILSNLFLNREFEKYIARQQSTKADDLVSNLSVQYNEQNGEWNTEYIHGAGMYAMYDGYIVKVYDRNGDSIWDAENHDMAMCMQIMEEISERMEERRPDMGGAFVSHEYDLALNGNTIGSVSISYYGPYFLSDSDLHFLDTLNIILLIIGVLSLVLALVISQILARRIVRPISKTAYIAKQISEGDYSKRFAGRAKSRELDELVGAVNTLAEGLAGQEELRKRLTVDVAHELRTPLTTLGSHLEAMIEGVWEPTKERLLSCYEEIDRLSGLTADLERLAKTESDHLVLKKDEIDLMDIVRQCCRNFEIRMKQKNLKLAAGGSSSYVNADKDRLSQITANLLSNAMKYTPEGGTVQILVEDTEKEGILIVEDDGIGIPEAELDLVFERFYRTDESRNRKTGGAGIGLAIVKSIVLAHGGSVRAERRTEGGSRFTVILPKDAAEDGHS